MYSFNQNPNVLDFPPSNLSKGYIIAISGALIVRKAILIILLKYISVNLNVNVIKAK